MDTNEDVVAFNAQTIQDNGSLLKSGLGVASATPSSNAQLVAANSKKIDDIATRSKENKVKIAKLYGLFLFFGFGEGGGGKAKLTDTYPAI